jgi:hypothetical protein
MKTLSKLLLTVLFSLYSVILFATSYTWNGGTSTAWGTGTNWTPNGVPGSGDNVTIVTTSNQPVYDGVAGVTNLTMTSGTLNLSGYQLNITGTATFNGGTINNGRVNATGGTSTFSGTTFGAVVWVNSGSIALANSVFNDSLHITKSGSGVNYAGGDNTFNGHTIIENSGSGSLYTSNYAADTFNVKVVYKNTGNGGLVLDANGYGTSSATVYNGDVEIINTGTSGYISMNNRKKYFNGNVVINNTSTSGVSFGNGPHYLATGKTISIGSTGFTAGTLVLKNIIQVGTQSHTFTTTGSTTRLELSGNTFNGIVNGSSAQLLFHYNTFNDSIHLTKTGAGLEYSSGDNTFNEYAVIENTGSGGILTSNYAADTFNVKVVYKNTGNGSITADVNGYNTSSATVYNGDVEIINTGTSGYISMNNRKKYFNGNVVINNTSTSGVSFGNGPHYLATGKTISIGSTGFTAGTLVLKNIIQVGTQSHTFTTTGSTTRLELSGNTFNGIVNGSSAQLLFHYNTFNDSIHLTKTGAGLEYSSGDNTFNEYAVIENTGSGGILTSNYAADTFNVKVVYKNTGNGSITADVNGYNTSSATVYNGDVEIINTGTSGYISMNNRKKYFNGNVVINNTSTSGVSFGNGPHYLATGKTISIGSTGFTAGTLVLKNIIQVGTQSHTFTTTGSTTRLELSGNTFNGIVYGSSAQLLFHYNTFNDSIHLTKTGAGLEYSSGDNTFNEYAVIENTGSGGILTSNYAADTFNVKVVYKNTGNGSITADVNGYNTSSATVYNDDVEIINTGTSGYISMNNRKKYFNGNVVINNTSTSGVSFGNGPHYLASGKTISIGGTGFTAGTLTLNKIIQAGSASVNLTATSSGGISTGNCNWGGNFTANAPNIYNTGNNKFSGKVYLTKTSNTANTWSGGNKFSDSLTLVNSGTSYITMANGVGADTLLGHVKLNNTSSGSIYAAERYSNLFYGNITASQNVYFANNDGIVLLKGSADQTFSRSDAGTTPTNFKKLTVDKTSADDLFTLNKPINVSSVLTLTKGRIATNSTNYANLLDNATVAGASNDSYVDGVVRKTGNDAFTYPVGKNGHYRKIGISAPSSTTDAFTAEYFEVNSNDTYSHSAKDGSIAELSRNEYWNLARTTGTSNVSVTLSIDSATSCSVDNLSNLKVAAWDGSTWKDKGNGGTSGDVYVGTVVSSGSSNVFGVYGVGTGTSFECNPGTSCADVIELGSGDTCLTNINMANKEMWFSFVADSSYLKIEVINPTDSSSGYVNNITLYTGVCTSLSTYLNHELEMDTVYESIFGVYPDSIIENETYYVRLGSNKPIFNFNVCIENLFSTPKEGEENCDNVCPENLINNGDFELGNTGFLSDLTFLTTNPPLSPGQYSITTNANNLNTNWVNAPGASGNGLFMVCDDAIDAVNQNSILWYQIVSNLEANTYYCVSAWVRSLPRRNLITDPDIMLTVANNGTGMFYQVSTGTIQEVDGWVNIRVLVFSGNSTWAEVFLYSIPNGTQSTGNDIGIDDIEFKKVYTPLTDIILEYENEKCMGSLVDFTSGALFDNNDEITWYFGDGTSATQVINPLHIYSQPGQYNVRLKVENCTGEVNLCNIISVTPYVEGEYNDNEPGCCSYYNEYDGTDDIDGSFDITTNTTWTTSRAIKNTLTVKSGNALTIDGASNGIDIEFGPWGKIIVERGAHLIVENARLRGLIDCGTMWQGIEVWGNPAYSSNALFQGKITLGARAMIIDAHNGVMLGKFRFPSCSLPVPGSLKPSPYDLAYSGGIINANNSWFVDNAISIRFAPYNKPNTSVIKHSRFNPTALTGGDAPFNSNGVNDPGYLTGNSYMYQNNYNKNYLQHNADQISSRHIYMWGVRIIPIEDNFFWQSDIGIDAYDSRFKAIDGSGGLDGNEFKEERICIRGAHTVNPVFYNSVISDNNFLGPFEDGDYGVQVTGGKGYRIDEVNEFNIDEAPVAMDQGGIGISMSGSQGFNILNNDFKMLRTGVLISSSGLGGGLIGTDPLGDGNFFTSNRFGTGTIGKNLALKIKCNDYLNDFDDLFAQNWLSYGWLSNQGQIPPSGDPNPEKRPAGNTFNPYDYTHILYKPRDICSVDHPYNYYHHEPIISGGQPVLEVVPTATAIMTNTLVQATNVINVAGVTKTSTACEPLQFTPDDWDAMVTEGTNNIIDLREKRDSISELIDGGETEELLDAIADTALNADTLEVMLNEHWPLSDEVLSTFIQIIGRIPYTNYREVILGNEPMAEQQFYELMQAIDTISNEIVFELKYGQGNSDSLTLTKLDWEIQREGLERQLAFNSLISYYVDDNDSADYALELLEADNMLPWSAGSKQLLFASLLADSNLTAADDVLKDFEPVDEEEENWKDLSEVMLQLAMDSLTVFEMDSAQEALVREIAYYGVNSNAQANSQSILLLVYGEEFNPTIEEPSGKTDETNQPSPPSNTSDMLFRFYPNPSTGELNCTYKTDESDAVYLLFFDLSGSKIIEKQLQGGNNTGSISLSEFGQGVYLYKVIVNSGIEQTGKIVVINK